MNAVRKDADAISQEDFRNAVRRVRNEQVPDLRMYT